MTNSAVITNRSLQYHVDGTSPQNGEVFVFGSNLQGIHTKGAARFAINKGLADEGQIQGVSKNGKAYAIPTQSDRQSLPISEVKLFSPFLPSRK